MFQKYDVVWARQKGYPLWPAVITPNPLTGQWVDGGMGRNVRYHCTFLAWNKEWSMLERDSITSFSLDDIFGERRGDFICKIKKYDKAHREAVGLALDILNDPLHPEQYLVRKNEEVEEHEKLFVAELLAECRQERLKTTGTPADYLVDDVINNHINDEIFTLERKNR